MAKLWRRGSKVKEIMIGGFHEIGLRTLMMVSSTT